MIGMLILILVKIAVVRTSETVLLLEPIVSYKEKNKLILVCYLLFLGKIIIYNIVCFLSVS